MAKIERLHRLKICPEQFLKACSPEELLRIDRLLRQARIKKNVDGDPDFDEEKFISVLAEARQELEKYYGSHDMKDLIEQCK